jgi:hypothetical protein
MPKTPTYPNPRRATIFILLARDPNGKKVASVPSPCNLEGTRRMAQEVMGLLSETACVEVYTYEEGMLLASAHPIETIHREGALQAGQCMSSS